MVCVAGRSLLLSQMAGRCLEKSVIQSWAGALCTKAEEIRFYLAAGGRHRRVLSREVTLSD